MWANEPLSSGQLVRLAAEALGWKKSTTYTVLKKLCERGILLNEGGAVTALIKQDEVQRQTSAAVVERTFGGSLPRFVAAFLNEKPISESEAAQIRALLDAAQRREEDPMTAFLLYLLKAGAAGGAAALAAWALCALLRKARTPGWLLCAVWLAVGLRFAAPGGLIPVALPRPQNPALAGAAAAVTEAAKTLAAAPAQTGRALTLVRLEAAEAAPAAALPGPAFWGRAALDGRHGRAAGAGRCTATRGCGGRWRWPAKRQTAATPAKRCARRSRSACCARASTCRPALQGPDRAAVLRHERTHIRRGDTLTKPLFYALVCLHWWNPLAWLAFRQFERAAEQACDEAARVRGHPRRADRLL